MGELIEADIVTYHDEYAVVENVYPDGDIAIRTEYDCREVVDSEQVEFVEHCMPQQFIARL